MYLTALESASSVYLVDLAAIAIVLDANGYKEVNVTKTLFLVCTKHKLSQNTSLSHLHTHIKF